ASGLELTVDLHDDPVSEAIADKRLLGLCETELPRDAGVLQRCERSSARTSVVARYEHHIGLGLGNSGSHGADTDLCDQLDVHPRERVGRLEVVYELGNVL